MTNPEPIRCAYCGTISTWSSEQIEETALAETPACTACEQQTRLWDGQTVAGTEVSEGMAWAAPQPLH